MALEMFKKILTVDRKLLKYQEPERYLIITIIEILLYLAFVVLVTIVGIGMVSTSMFYLTHGFQKLFIETSFLTPNNVEINFGDIKSVSDIWAYFDSVLMDGFYWNANEIGGYGREILYQNKLLGVPRLRQLKTRNGSCVVHEYFRDMFLTCYNEYSAGNEDKDSFGLKNGTAWTYQTSQDTKSESYMGRVALYQGGGFYQDLGVDREKSRAIIAGLKEHLWITRGTRCIFVDFAVYNANINLFSIVKFIFELPSTGGVIPSHSFNTVKLIRYFGKVDYLIMSCELLIVGFLILYTIQEIIEINHNRLQYLKDFWNYIDLIILIIAYCFMILQIIIKSIGISVLKKNINLTAEYANFEYLTTLQNTYNYMFALFLFLVYIKLFKYLKFNKSMGQLNNTLHRCALDIIGFSVMFLIIFTAYAELGYLLFGTRVEGFRSLGASMFTLLRTILGDFDYSEIEAANRIFAPIFFLSYIFLVFFVLLNMFLAIINDTYSEVKSELELEPEEMHMSQYFKRCCSTFLSKIGCRKPNFKTQQQQSEYITMIDKIRRALKKCGFTNMEIAMFFHRYNIDPTAKVEYFDIEQLIQDLQDTSSEPDGTSIEKGGIQTNNVARGSQQERLSAIEKNLDTLTRKIDLLLDTLATVKEVQVDKFTAKQKK